MRFQHHDFYLTRASEDHDPAPDWDALTEMIRRHLIHAGLRTWEAEYLLGKPYNLHDDDRTDTVRDWKYGTANGTLALTFDEGGKLTEVLNYHDGMPEDAYSVDLLTGKQEGPSRPSPSQPR